MRSLLMIFLMSCGSLKINKPVRPDIDWVFDDGSACMVLDDFRHLLLWMRENAK